MNKLLEKEFWNTASVEDVKKALDEGADVNARHEDGYAPMHFAGEMQVEAISLLIKAGADVNTPDKDGDTPLHFALYRDDETIREDIVEKLLEAGADVNACGQYGNTPMYKALINHEKHELIVKLIEAGKASGGINNIPLYPAILIYSQEVIQMLLDAGADVNARDEDGNTSLHLAVLYKKTALIELLLNRGANAKALNKDMDTPFDIAQTKYEKNTKSYSLLNEAQYMSKKDIIEAMHYYKASELTIKADSYQFLKNQLDLLAEEEKRQAEGWEGEAAQSARRLANHFEYRAMRLRQDWQMLILRAEAHRRKATGEENKEDRERDESAALDAETLKRHEKVEAEIESKRIQEEKEKREQEYQKREQEYQKKREELIEAKRRLAETEDPEETDRLKTEISSLEFEIRSLQPSRLIWPPSF